VLRADPLSPVQVGVADPLATAPPAVAAFFRRALAPDPTARFQGAAAFMAALEQALEP
jgi:hypothetical protein